MYLLYLDESGNSRNLKHFVLGGAIIQEDDWKYINNKITDIKKEYLNDVYVDLKGLRKWKRKIIDHRRYNPFNEFSKEIIDEIANKYFNILGEGKITFLASVINREELGLLKLKHELYENQEYMDSYKFLIERFDLFLKEKNEYGTIHVEEGDRNLPEKLKNAHERFMRSGTEYQKIEKIIECCNFIKGPKNNFIQIADLFVSSVFVGVEFNNYRYYNMYKPYIRCREYDGKILGFGIKYHPNNYDSIDLKQLDNKIHTVKLNGKR